jgi:prefoldin subunit 5
VTRTPVSKLVETVEAVETIQRQLEALTSIVERLAVRLTDLEQILTTRPAPASTAGQKPRKP